MGKVRKVIDIKAPPRVIWRILEGHMKRPERPMADPSSGSHPIVQLTGRPLTEQRVGVGARTRWIYLWRGRPFEWDDVVTEWIEEKRIAWKTTSGWDMEDGFTLEPARDGTSVAYDMRYRLPHGPLGQIYEHLVFRRYVHQHLDATMRALKDAAEKIASLKGTGLG